MTRDELKAELKSFRTEFKTELKAELKADLKAELKVELDERFAAQRREISLDIADSANRVLEVNQRQLERMADRLSQDIARSALVVAEHCRMEIRALDDRYRDLPRRLDALERSVEEHRNDEALHRQPRPRRPR